MPAIRPNWRSSGEATDDAMVSGLAPGRLAETWMTGNSTWGSGATGRKLKASAPDSNRAAVSSEVPTGLLMKGAEIFMQLAASTARGNPYILWQSGANFPISRHIVSRYDDEILSEVPGLFATLDPFKLRSVRQTD